MIIFFLKQFIDDYLINGKARKGRPQYAGAGRTTKICRMLFVTHTVTCGPRVLLAPQSVWNVLVFLVKDYSVPWLGNLLVFNLTCGPNLFCPHLSLR